MKLKPFNGLVNSLLILLLSLFIEMCGPATLEQNKPGDNKEQEALIRVNKYMVKKDADNINAYCKRHRWNMKETGSGLRYEIITLGSGSQPKPGMQVTLKYRSELLDGTYCYSSDSSGNKIFCLGSGKAETGLEEGICLMKAGDKARFILPPHLAFGLIGDNNRIPPRSTIVYNVELLKVESTKSH